MNTITDYLDHWTQIQAHKTLFAFLNIKGIIKEQYTYRQFSERVNIIASHLQNQSGLQRGDSVILIYPPGLEIIAAFLACAKIGLTPVPVAPPSDNNFYAALQKLHYIVKDSGAKRMFSTRKYQWFFRLQLAKQQLGNLFGVLGADNKKGWTAMDWITTDDFFSIHPSKKSNLNELVIHQNSFGINAANLPFKKPFEFWKKNEVTAKQLDRVSKNESATKTAEKTSLGSPTELLFLQYTSGSTSQPKGVMVSHQNVINNAYSAVNHTPIAVSWLPQFHDMGLIGYYLFILIKGGTTYGFSPVDFIKKPFLWLETISKVRATVASGPNFAFEYCLREDKIANEDLKGLDLSSLKVMMNAAEPVRAATFINFYNRFKKCGLRQTAFSAAYGLAENTIVVSMNGRNILSLNREKLAKGIVKRETFNIESTQITNIVCCGKPADHIKVRIVNPTTNEKLPTGRIGEVWVTGKSKCWGYWNKPALTENQFQATLPNEYPQKHYLKTGDLGFLYEGELYICGRIKDMIIIHGVNYYPHDIEKIVEDSSKEIRKGAVVCFGIEKDQQEQLIVLAELKKRNKKPDPSILIAAIRRNFNIQPAQLVFLPKSSIPKTSSGKVSRSKSKKLWMEGNLMILNTHKTPENLSEVSKPISSPFEQLKKDYQLKGDENINLFEAGLDSLAVVSLMAKIKEILQQAGAEDLVKGLDTRIFHHLSVANLFDFAEQLAASPQSAIHFFKKQLDNLKKEQQQYELEMMRRDSQMPIPKYTLHYPKTHSPENILLTGGTGFLGAFILESLLTQTTAKIYLLIRAKNSSHALIRLKTALIKSKTFSSYFQALVEQRVVPICGDLSLPRLGLPEQQWQQLVNTIDTIYHNGALVNYILSYDDLRPANVIGTHTLLQLASAQKPKIFNHISTTFIFGWTNKDVLFETDNNEQMSQLDFGYSQSKWVSEQLVLRAFQNGLKGRIFRPALITPSTKGGGYHFDITMRLFAFLIQHGLSSTAKNQMSLVPVDIVADNVVAISNLSNSLNKTFHVTMDTYTNLGDITRVMGQLRHQHFDYKEIRAAMTELQRRCTPKDLLYPLLDFFLRSTENIAAMEFKRYHNDNYRQARANTPYGKADVALEETVEGIVRFLEEQGVVSKESGRGRLLKNKILKA